MSSLVYFNGILVPEREVALPPTDRSYLYGEGLFETMLATRGFIPFLREHLERLQNGMKVLDFQMDLSGPKLEFALYQTLLHNHMKDAVLRLTLSRQNENLSDTTWGENYNLLIFVRPIPSDREARRHQGARTVKYPHFRKWPGPLSAVKATNYLEYLQAKKYAEQHDAEEALILNAEGRIAEGSTTNIFLYTQDRWLTPSFEEGPLPGVTRRILLKMMERLGIPHEEAPVLPEAESQIDEAFLTNAVWEILPVTKIDGRPLGSAKPGKHTQHLQELWAEEIQYRWEQYESKAQGM